jgi:hypothetical protein
MLGEEDVCTPTFLLRKVAQSKVLHPVMKMNEHETLPASHVHKTNWNFGISTGYTWKKPYKSYTYEVPKLQTKLESDWNLCAKHWNSNLLEQIPIYWNRVGILEPTSGLADALFKLPSMHTPTHIVTRARTKNWFQKYWGKKIPPNLSTGRCGVRLLFSVVR